MLNRNLILQSDSYKFSHPWQFPPGASNLYSYFESRGGRYGSTLFFGLQYLLKEYLEGSVISPGDVDEAEDFLTAHGEPFHREGWDRIARTHEGRLPIRVKAISEGTLVPTHNVLMTVESTDSETFWITSWIETMMVRLWYPITVASQSFHIKRIIWEYLSATSNDPKGELPFKLHDFGARGVSSHESAGIGGMSHLVNFQGSDTIEGVRFANHYYNHREDFFSGFSIPASEHSTITAWGRENEMDAYRNMVKQFAKPGKIVACVSDSYDLFSTIEDVWGDVLRDEVKNSGGTLVIRPDSGNPPEVVLKCLQILERKVGMEKNLRGYKVLPDYFRLIQGDGVNEDSIAEILSVMKTHGYSASNIAFGCGGALLQKLNRDTQKFAYKCSEITVNGQPREVFKDPITDKGKKSKAGRLSLVLKDGQFTTVQGEAKEDQLVTVFENGEVLKETTLDEVRKRAERSLF